jgi:hypothetical protein
MAQSLIAWVLVALAALYLLRRLWRTARRGGSCGGCRQCTGQQPARLITLERRPARRAGDTIEP